MRIAIDIDNTFVIRKAGSRIYEFRVAIAKRDEQFFMDTEFDKYIEEDETGTISESETKYLINLIKQLYQGESTNEQHIIWCSIEELLRDYCKFTVKTQSQ